LCRQLDISAHSTRVLAPSLTTAPTLLSLPHPLPVPRIPDTASKISGEKLIKKNPLLDGSLLEGMSSGYKVRSLSSLSITDLCALHVAFDKADDDGSGELDTNEFVEAFLPLLAADAGDVSLLFMRIDANCDGTVSWEEFLTYILSQDEGALQIETESSRQVFDYPSVSDASSQVNGHKDTAAGVLVLADADRYMSFSRKGDLLVWKPDGLEGLKVQHPREFPTDLPFITGMVHAKRLSHSDRLALCSADKQLIFVDLMRDSCKLSGTVKLDISPLCMCTVVLRDDAGSELERMLAFGDDAGQIHLYKLDTIGVAAERNLMAANSRKATEGLVRSWLTHDKHAWLSKVEYVEDLRTMISCASDGQIVLSDVEKGIVKVDGLKHRGEVHDFVWLPRVQLLASCGVERHINLWQLPIKTPVYQLDAHQASVQQLIYGAGQMFSIDTSKTIVVWDLREMAPIQRLEALKMHQEYPVGCIAYDERRSALLTLSRKMLLWHMNQRKVPNGHISPVTACVYNPTFELIVSADDSSVVRVWDLNTGKAVFRFTNAHTNKKMEAVKISTMCFDQTNRRLISGAHDGSVKVWNFSTGQCLRELTGFGGGEVTALCQLHVTPYDYYVGCGWNRKVTFWVDGQEQGGGARPHAGPDSTTNATQHFEGHKDDILCMAHHPETGVLVTGSYDGDIILWATDTGHARSRLVLPGILAMKGDQRPIEAIGLIECGKRCLVIEGRQQVTELVVLVVTVGGDGVVRFWSSDSTAELLFEFPLTGQDVGLVDLAVCHKTSVMIIADALGFIYILDIQRTLKSGVKSLQPTSQPLHAPVQHKNFRAHQTAVSALGYIKDRRVIFTGAQDCTICLWTLEGERLGTFGEPKEWKMDAESHHYHQLGDVPALGSKYLDEQGGGGDDKAAKKSGAKNKAKNQKRVAPHKTPSAAPDAKQSPITLPVDSIKSDVKAEAPSSSFFMTQDPSAEEAPAAPAAASAGAAEKKAPAADPSVQSVDDFVAAAEAAESSDDYDDDSDIEEDGGDDDRMLEMTDEEKRAVMLKVDIDDIVSRGVAMKERGEKFFESGRREVSAYQKMIVRDLDGYTLPDNISKRMAKVGGGKKGAEKKAAIRGLMDEDALDMDAESQANE